MLPYEKQNEKDVEYSKTAFVYFRSVSGSERQKGDCVLPGKVCVLSAVGHMF